VLTSDEVRHVAMLARLGLTDEEIEIVRAQLLGVLDYIAMLQQIDTSAIPPTAQVGTHLNVFRDDVPRMSWPVEEVLSNAPAREGPFVRVPAVFEEFRELSTPGEISTDSEGVTNV
jgi:aspartyl-tRNA(Asn)/glutamyl-tRNA(Gln) amidotransferase subunit C